MIAWLAVALAGWPEGGCEGMPCTPVAALAEAPVIVVGEVIGYQYEQGVVDHLRHSTVVQVRVETVLRGRVEGDVVEVWPGGVYGDRLVVVGELGQVDGRILSDVIRPLERGGLFSPGTGGELLGRLDVSFPLQCLGPQGWARVVGDDEGLTCPDTHRLGFSGFLQQLRAAVSEAEPSTMTVAGARAHLVPNTTPPFEVDGGIRFRGYEPRTDWRPADIVDPLPDRLDSAPRWVSRPPAEAVPSRAVRRSRASQDARFWRYAEPGHYAATKAAVEAAGVKGDEARAMWAESRAATRAGRMTWAYEELMALRDAVEAYRELAWREGAHEVSDWLLERQLDLESMTRDGPVDEAFLGVQARLLVEAAERCEGSGCEVAAEVAKRARPFAR